MRRYNKKVPDSAKVKFYGFDMQSKTLAVKNIVAKLKILDSTLYQKSFNALDSFKVFNIINKIKFRRLDDKQADSAKQLLTAIKTYIDNNNYKMVKLFTINDIAYLKRDVRLVEQCLDQSLTYGNISGDDYKLRNKYMAENIEWISKYEGPESKIMLCAHNGHISKDDMGSYLKKDYKDQYYAIGFDFNKGSFRAIDIDKSHHTPPFFTVNEAKKGSSGELFNKLNIPAFFIDVEKAIKPNSEAKSFFNKNIEQRNIGWGFSTAKEKNFYSGGSIYSKFDGFIFINATTPTIGS
ncbi:MAG: erythromycin esterase [Mucilaginibacter sp.]|nr:erythromycin esterase [Mucilaginibacter sp.]